MKVILYALMFMLYISTASAGKVILTKQRVDYFDKRFLGWTCEGMAFPRMSGNPMKPDDLSDIIGADPRCGVFFAVDVSKFQLTCLPAMGPNKKDNCKPVKDQNSILYVMRRTDYDGILPPIENIGNTGGMVAAGGISPALASRVDPTGFWSAGFSDGDGTGYFASQFSANPANVGSVMGLGEQGMFPPIAGMPGAEWEDIKQYNYFVQGIITRDMDPSEKQQYAMMARMNGQKVKPANPLYYGTDNEMMANQGYMAGVAADKAAAAAAEAAPADADASTPDSVDDTSTPVAPAADSTAADTPAASPSVTTNDMMSLMTHYMLFMDKDVDDLPLPMNTGMGAQNNMMNMMAMNNLNSLILKAYHRGEHDELNKQSKQLRSPRAGGDDFIDAMRMQQMMGPSGAAGASMGMGAAGASMGMGMGMMPGCSGPVNTPQVCQQALMTAGACAGEVEDQNQYKQICMFGACVLTGMTRNPDIDQEEVIRYSRCAAMSGNAAMNKIFASVGLAAAPVAGASTGAAPATGGAAAVPATGGAKTSPLVTGMTTGCGQPVNTAADCQKAIMTAGLCVGEVEDRTQYTQICTFGACILSGMQRNPDIDQEEVMRYSRCATMSGNAAMNKIFASVGLAAPMAAGAAAGGAASTGMGAMGMGMGAMGMGMGMEMDEDAMFAAQMAGALNGGAGASAGGMSPLMFMEDGPMSDGMEMDGMYPGMYAAQAAAAVPAVPAATEAEPAATTISRLLRKTRQMSPNTFNPMQYGMMEDSEDYFNAMQIQQYFSQMPQGSQLNLANGMIGMDFMDDIGENGMLGMMGGLGALTGAATTGGSASAGTATTATGTTATGTKPCGSYQGILPLDGIDQGEFYMYAPVVMDISACLGPMAINDGVNSDTVAIYAAMRGMQAPATAPAATAPAFRRLRRPRYTRRTPLRNNGYRKYAF